MLEYSVWKSIIKLRLRYLRNRMSDVDIVSGFLRPSLCAFGISFVKRFHEPCFFTE